MQKKTGDSVIAELVSRMTIEEKISLIPTHQKAIDRLGLQEFHIGGEGAHGLVSPVGKVTTLPETLGLAATWDEEFLEELGTLVAEEAEIHYLLKGGSGGLMLWAPTVDMERDPRWGRTGEGYGEDPLLTSRLAGAYMQGLMGSAKDRLRVAPTLKHFYANNNEEGRMDGSSNLDPAEKRDYYLKVYEKLLRDREIPSIMTAYNAIDGVPAMVHNDILRILRGEWGWDGCLVCEGGALTELVEAHHFCKNLAEAAALSLNAGVDVLTDDRERVIEAVRTAVSEGLVTEMVLNRAISRSLLVRYKLGALYPVDEERIQATAKSALYRKESRILSREASRKSIVLLKNREASLPLDPRAVQNLAVIGPLADVNYRDWYGGESSYSVTALQALIERLGAERVSYADGLDRVALSTPDGTYLGVTSWNDSRIVADRPSPGASERFILEDWGWNSYTFKALSNGEYLTIADGQSDHPPVSASSKSIWGWCVKERFEGLLEKSSDGKKLGMDRNHHLIVDEGGPGLELKRELMQSGIAEAVKAAEGADVAVIFVGTHPLINGKEEQDRESLELPPAQVRLIQAVAKVNKRTIVVLVTGHPVACDPWMDDVSAILHTVHGGQEAGYGISDILFGNESPSGRLPMTWPRSDAVLPPIRDYRLKEGKRTYRYQKDGILFPFGFGLSYGDFTYESIKVEGMNEDLLETRQFDFFGTPTFRIWVLLRNQGLFAARETIQVYCRALHSRFDRPAKELIAFSQKRIESRETVELQFTIELRDLGVWDTRQKAFVVESGEYEILVGPSSEKLPLKACVRVPNVHTAERSPLLEQRDA